ncbi:MAG: MAPEG family protein [Deltaproteobacteria bacterium]|nr:MAG: MAPEG family protein [Deltaproteobacteria bacterium]
MTTALTCIGLLGLLVIGLGLGVSMTRAQTGTNFGYAADPADRLHKIVRAHGNASEYAPILAILIYVTALGEPASWVIWAGVVATVCRYLHAVGMLATRTLDALNPLRFVGALGTYLAGLALVVAVFAG